MPSLISNDQRDIVVEEIICSPYFSNPENQLSETSRVHIEEVCNVILLDAEQFLKEAYNLCHTRVTELCVFMLSTSDQVYSPVK